MFSLLCYREGLGPGWVVGCIWGCQPQYAWVWCTWVCLASCLWSLVVSPHSFKCLFEVMYVYISIHKSLITLNHKIMQSFTTALWDGMGRVVGCIWGFCVQYVWAWCARVSLAICPNLKFLWGECVYLCIYTCIFTSFYFY